MDQQAQVMSSPFSSGVRPIGSDEAGDPASGRYRGVSSPFSEGLLDAGQSESDAALAGLAEELADEEFDEAVQALVDQAAGRHLVASQMWSTEETELLAEQDVESWIAGLAAGADQLVERLERQFADRTPESLIEGEIDTALAEALAEQGAGLDGEEFYRTLAKKAGALVNGAAKLAKRGIALAGRHLLGPLFAALRKLVRPLLQRVLAMALNKLPAHLRPAATMLAGKLGITVAAGQAPGAALAEQFDVHLARTVVTDNQAMADHLIAEWEQPVEEAGHPAIAGLDSAREELADQVYGAAPESVLTSQVERFLPAVMAVLPLVRTGIGVLGRDKVVNAIAQPLANLIKPHVGAQASQALSRAIADKGLGLLRLEAELDGGPALLGAEALASTVEDTIRSVGQLPPESLAQPLRVRAELQEAFAEAAARYLPSEFLRADLGVQEIDGESAVWVLMPRGPGRRYRYRKCSQIFPTVISRNVAKAITTSDGGTLEQLFLDEGVTGWPLEAEVHLFETLPGTHLGHLAGAEGPADVGEFEQLTPRTAALLLNQPGLGRRAPGVGGRYYRLVTPGRPPRRRRFHRAVVTLALSGPVPVLRVHLRLSEGGAHRIGELLAKHADVALVASFRSLVAGLARRSLPDRIARQGRRRGTALTAQQARALAACAGEQMVTALSAQLRTLAPAMATAAADPAEGVTISFEFTFADKAALLAGRSNPPTVTVRPGLRHG